MITAAGGYDPQLLRNFVDHRESGLLSDKSDNIRTLRLRLASSIIRISIARHARNRFITRARNFVKRAVCPRDGAPHRSKLSAVASCAGIPPLQRTGLAAGSDPGFFAVPCEVLPLRALTAQTF